MNEHDTEVIVSVLFNESKLLKSCSSTGSANSAAVSVLFNESKLLKFFAISTRGWEQHLVSVLFNESKLLKSIGKSTKSQMTLKFQYSSTSRNC